MPKELSHAELKHKRIEQLASLRQIERLAREACALWYNTPRWSLAAPSGTL